MFEAKYLGSIYHFTNLFYLNNILKENKLCSKRTLSDLIDNEYQEDLQKPAIILKHLNSSYTYISFTRDKNLPKRISMIDTLFTCRIDFDSSKLSNLKYGLNSISYFKKKENVQSGLDESEEIIILDKGKCIDNIKSFILKLKIPSLDRFQKYSEISKIIDVNKSLLIEILQDLNYPSEKISNILLYNYDSYIEEDVYMYLFNNIKKSNIAFEIFN